MWEGNKQTFYKYKNLINAVSAKLVNVAQNRGSHTMVYALLCNAVTALFIQLNTGQASCISLLLICGIIE